VINVSFFDVSRANHLNFEMLFETTARRTTARVSGMDESNGPDRVCAKQVVVVVVKRCETTTTVNSKTIAVQKGKKN
jgi:hypothetical protein